MQQTTVTRLVTEGDAKELAGLLSANRAFLAPFEPERAPLYFTADGQRAVIRNALASHAQGASLPHVIRVGTGELAGRITLNGIVRGSFLSCSVGYWVGEAFTRRGLASAALREIIGIAFATVGQQGLGLHRIQAETLLENIPSQRVLRHAGFSQIGMAPTYLKIAGKWQDMLLFQLINPVSD